MIIFPKHTNINGNAHKQKGLTLVESLVAVSILVISVFGPMSIVSQALKTSYYTRNQITAFYLAEEAVEHIKNLRDRNSLQLTNPTGWLDSITSSAMVTNTIGATNLTKYSLTRNSSNQYVLDVCDSAGCPLLNFNTTTRAYGGVLAGGVIPSIYTREVIFYKTANDSTASNEVIIEVVVKWRQGIQNYRFIVREHMMNWKLTN